MKRAGTSRGKLTGIYTRGNTFWFTYRLNGKKHFHSLGTSDYGEAVQKALAIRQTPELAPAAVFAREIDAFIAHKRARNEYSKRSAGVKVHALKELAAATGRANPASVTTANVTSFCRRLQTRVTESTAHGYLVTLRSFYNWLRDEKKVRSNPVADPVATFIATVSSAFRGPPGVIFLRKRGRGFRRKIRDHSAMQVAGGT